MNKHDLARKIAGRVFHAELCASRMLGADEIEALDSAFDAHDESYNAAFDPDRPAVLTRFRPIPPQPAA